jgi:HSP20 family protein
MDTKQPTKIETAPVPLFRQFARDLDNLLDRFGFGFDPFKRFELTKAFWMPDVEVFERGGELVVRADLPGLKKEDITLDVTETELVIHGERKQWKEESGDTFYRCERRYGEFVRTIPLPEGVKIDRANAVVRDGVLEVKMPIAKIQQKTRRLEIQEPAAVVKPTKHAA